MIRVESEETQDYVREAKSTEDEEEEERTFVPSAVTVSRKWRFRCDSQCSEKILQLLAAGVGGDFRKERNHTLPTHARKCYDESLKAKGRNH